jgi:hypothetical protein
VKGYGPETFGERFSGVYDRWTDSRLSEAKTLESVEVFADLAGRRGCRTTSCGSRRPNTFIGAIRGGVQHLPGVGRPW